jgi:hypothetical protein
MARPITAKARVTFWVVTLVLIALGTTVLFLTNYQSALYPDAEGPGVSPRIDGVPAGPPGR